MNLMEFVLQLLFRKQNNKYINFEIYIESLNICGFLAPLSSILNILRPIILSKKVVLAKCSLNRNYQDLGILICQESEFF